MSDNKYSGLTLSYSSSSSYNIISFNGPLAVNSLFAVTPELNKYTKTDHPKNLVLDLSEVESIDSSGIRLLINLEKKMKECNKQLYILQPSDNVLSILQETNMLKVLSIIDSHETLEKLIMTNIYESYLPYTKEEGGLRRVNCSCVVCGSHDVIGYLIDQNSFDWRWVADDPFPTAYKKGSDEQINLFSLLPIVCRECYMISTRLTDFNIIASDNSIAIKSTIDEDSKNLLTKSIKKRKKMTETDVIQGDNFFLHPRGETATYKAYEIAEFCIRTISVMKTNASHYDVGYLNYLVLRYAEAKQKEEYINNCRTWFTQAMQDISQLTTSERAITYFVLIVSDLNLDKKKEASLLRTEFTKMIEELPPTVSSEGIYSPIFWFKQAENIWKKEIEAQSSSMKV